MNPAYVKPARPGEDEEQAGQLLAPPLDEIMQFLERYTLFPSENAVTVLGLWIPHTWVFNCFDETPYLHISSPVKRCGKSRLLKCLKFLCPRPWAVVNPSEAVVYRKIERDKPTFLLDEVDAIYSRNANSNAEGLRALLNAGYERAARVPRCVGATNQLIDFAVYCPKALAGIGKLPDTVADRCLTIAMKRKPPAVVKERFIARDVMPIARPLAGKLEAWSKNKDVIAALRAARPAIPQGFDDRAADISIPLLAIADLAGGGWPAAGRKALAEICAVRLDDDESTATQLLHAIREIFAEKKATHIPTHDLLKALIEREDEPWAGWWEPDIANGNLRGPASKLARILKPFGIVPEGIRVSDKSTPKGYKTAAFKEAFDAYVPQ